MGKKWLAGIIAAALVLTGTPVTSHASEEGESFHVNSEEQPGEAADSSEAEEGRGTVDSSEAKEGTEAADGSKAEEGMEDSDSGEAGEGTKTPYGSNTEEGMEVADDSEAEKRAEVADGSVTKEGAEATDGSETEERMEATDSSEAEERTEATDGSETEEGMEAVDSGDIPEIGISGENDGQTIENGTSETPGVSGESVPAENAEVIAEADTEVNADAAVDIAVMGNDSRTAESGTWIPYEGAKYSLRYGVGDTGITIYGFADYVWGDELEELIIPAEIDGIRVTKIGDSAFSSNSGLTGELNLPDSVTEIGEKAFYFCSGLTGVKIPDGVEVIGSGAFGYCSGLTGELKIPDGITKIGEETFNNCSSLTGVKIPDGVEVIGNRAFYSCSGLTGELNLPDSIIEIGEEAFQHCSGLTGDLKIPGGVAVIGNKAFYYCSGLTGELMISEGVTKIGEYAFGSCSSLTGGLKLPDSVTEIGEYAFNNCSGLTGELKLPVGLTAIGRGAFSVCSGLTGELKLPDSVTEIGEYAFSACSSLTGELKLPAGMTVINRGVFNSCSGLTGELKLPEGLTVISSNAFYGCSGLTGGLKLPTGLTAISEYAFYGCNGLNGELKLPAGLTEIGNNAFNGCSGLIGELKLPTGLTVISEYVFRGCSNLTGVEIPTGVTVINKGAFQDCRGFTSELKLPDSITEIGEYAFSGCSGLTGELKLPGGLTVIGKGLFQHCSGLGGELKLPDSITEIGEYAFYNCSSLTGELKLPDSVTEIGNYAFNNCSGLTGELKLPVGLTVIKDGTFQGCSGLTGRLNLPDSVTEIGNYAFAYCTNLIKNVEIASTVEKIGENAFHGGNGIARITVLGMETAIQSGGLGRHSFISGYDGSTAENYAVENDCAFILLENVPEITEYRVSTAKELMEVIDSLGLGYSRIVLADGIYEVPLEGAGIAWYNAPVRLQGLVSVTIEAEHPGRAEILSENVEAPVISIEYSTDIRVSGCILGHRSDIEIGGCGEKGDVIAVQDSFDINIEDSDLYGCGITAVDCRNTEAVNLSGCILRDCELNVTDGYGEDLNIRNCIISGNAYRAYGYAGNPAFSYNGKALLENCLLFNNHNKEFQSEYGGEVETVDCSFYNNAWEEGQQPGDYGICLNGITWQVKDGTLKLGYPLYLDGNTVIQSRQGEVLNYSKSSLPWKLYGDLKVAVANGIQYDQSVITAVSGLDINVTAPMTEAEQEKLIKNLAEREGIAPEGASVEITVTNAADLLSEEDKVFIDRFAQANRVTASQYLDITMSILPQGGEKKPVKWIDVPIQLVVEVPENLRQEGRVFSAIRMHEGSFDLLQDLDTASDTVTIETNRFSTYVLVYKEAGKGSTIFGRAVRFGDPSGETNLKLLDYERNLVAEDSFAGNSAEYRFEEIEEGSYILRVSCSGHVTREYTVTAEGETVELDVEVWLRGDVNGDGEIDAKDKRILYNHIASGILDGYEFQVGDVDGSGEIDAKDKRMLYNHIAGTGLLW